MLKGYVFLFSLTYLDYSEVVLVTFGIYGLCLDVQSKYFKEADEFWVFRKHGCFSAMCGSVRS